MQKILRIVMLFALSLKVLTLHAQNVDVKMGEEMKVGSVFTHLFGADKEGNYYVFLDDGIKNSSILKYNKENVLVSKVTPNLSFLKGEDFYFTEYIVSNDKVFLIISTSDKKNQRVFAHEIDKKTLVVNPNGIKIGVFPFIAKSWDLKVSISVSPDKSKILLMANSVDRRLNWVYFNTKSKTSKKMVDFACFSLDADLTILNEYKSELPYTNEVFMMYDQTISNEGDVYLMGSYLDKSLDKKDDRTKEIIVEATPGGGHRVYKVELSGTKEPIRTAILNGKDPNQLIITGFYFDRENSYQKGGSFFMVLDKNSSKIISEKSFPYNATIGASFLNEKNIDKIDHNQVGIPNLAIKDIIYDNEGKTYLFAEANKVFTESYTRTYTDASGVMKTKTTYVNYMSSENILMFCFDKNGELIKQNAIKRYMQEVYSWQVKYNQSSFSTFYNPDNKCFYLNYYDSWNRKEKSIVTIKVDSNLNIGDKQEILDSQEEEVIFSPRLNCRLSPSEMVGLFFFKKYQRFAVFKFK